MISFLFLKNQKVFCGQRGAQCFLRDIFFDSRGRIERYVFEAPSKAQNPFMVAYGTLVANKDRIEAKNKLTQNIKSTSLLSCGNYILGARVYSESGFYFGKVFDVEISIRAGRTENILVCKHFLEKIFRAPLYINISHILAFDKDCIIVQDAFLKEFELKSQKAMA